MLGSISSGYDYQSMSDAEFVQLTLNGDPSAYDGLVLRYRRMVLNLAHSLLWDWDQAEDVAQQAFLETLAGLHRLKDASKFRSWLLTITRRCAARRYQEPRVEQLEHCGSVIYPLYGVRQDAVTDALHDRVKTSLNELSVRSRTVLVLHYLDGYSCKETGERLGIPTGTVKRILHESRNNLRISMGVDTRRKQEMPVSGKQNVGPRQMVWWLLCNGAPWGLLGALMPQSIFLAVNKKPLGIDKISESIDSNVGYVRESVDQLVREELLVKTSNGRYRTNFIAFDVDDWSRVFGELRNQGVQTAEVLAAQLPVLEDAWNHTTLPVRGFSWKNGIWPVLGLFISNVGVGHYSPVTPVPTIRDSGYKYWMGGYECVSDECKIWTTDLCCSGGNDVVYRFGYLFSRALNNVSFWLTNERTKVMEAVARGISDIGSIAADAVIDIEQSRNIAADLVQMGVMKRESDGLALTFPVINKEDDDILYPGVDRVSGLLYNDMLTAVLAGIPDKLTALGYGHLEDQFAVWQEWFRGMIMGEALRELVKRGVLPDPGSHVPATFSLVGWVQPSRIMTWTCGDW